MAYKFATKAYARTIGLTGPNTKDLITKSELASNGVTLTAGVHPVSYYSAKQCILQNDLKSAQEPNFNVQCYSGNVIDFLNIDIIVGGSTYNIFSQLIDLRAGNTLSFYIDPSVSSSWVGKTAKFKFSTETEEGATSTWTLAGGAYVEVYNDSDAIDFYIQGDYSDDNQYAYKSTLESGVYTQEETMISGNLFVTDFIFSRS